MVTTQPAVPDYDTTPEFNEQCLAVLGEWQTGTLPYESAVEQFEGLRRQARRHRANEARIEVLLGVMNGYRANLVRAVHHFERARELFVAVGNEQRILTCDLNLSEIYRQKGDFRKADQLFAVVYESAKRLNNVRSQTIALANRGQMLLSMHRLEEAQMSLLGALELTEQWDADNQRNLTELLTEVHHGLAEIYLQSGQPEAALQQARAALHQAQISNKPLSFGFANRTLADALSAFDEPVEPEVGFSTNANDYYRAAIEAFEGIGAEGEVARCMLAQARHLAKIGRRVPAARFLQQATLIFAQLGMVDDVAKAAEAQSEIF